MAFDVSAVQTDGTTRGRSVARTNIHQGDAWWDALDNPTVQAGNRRRAEWEAVSYISQQVDIPAEDGQVAERVFCDAILNAYNDTMRHPG
jgi:hypothetical protein